jgi:hypothetical protein
VRSMSKTLHDVAARASELTGVDASEIVRDLVPEFAPTGAWTVEFVGPSLQVREAVRQALREIKPVTSRQRSGTSRSA